ILGSLILFRSEGPRLPWTVIGGATAVTAAFFLVVVGAGLRAQRLAVRTGPAGLRGRRASVVERLAPFGMVRIDGELWRAAAGSPRGWGGSGSGGSGWGGARDSCCCGRSSIVRSRSGCAR